jgi:hypothetical protein
MMLAKVPNPDRVLALAQLMHRGGLTPKGVTKPEQIAARILAGMEVGLKPVQAINWIMVVNGRAVIWGDAALALVRASGWLETIEEKIEGDGDDRTAICTTKRKGSPNPHETRFSVADAKKAGLWDKEGPWQDYPDRQLMWRARGWNLRDEFGDVLSGLAIAEEEMDVPTVRQVQPEPSEVKAEPVEGELVIGDDILAALGLARPGWLRSQGVDVHDDAAVKEAWLKKLSAFGVESAKSLTPAQGRELLKDIATDGHRQEVKEVFEEAASESS